MPEGGRDNGEIPSRKSALEIACPRQGNVSDLQSDAN